MKTPIKYHIGLLQLDLATKGWNASDLARVSGCSLATVSRFLRGEIQTSKTASKVAQALGRPITRYIRTRERKAS